METTTNNQTSSVAQSCAVDYAAALRQYNRYGRGRSMKKFCEDEGYDYWKFCKLAREGQIDLNARPGEDKPGFVEVKAGGAVAQVVPEEPTPYNVSDYRYTYLLSKDAASKTKVVPLITRKEAELGL